MTISSTVNRISYTGDGSTTAFSFPYLFYANDDLTVIIVTTATGAETVKTLTTHYTVAGAGVGAGGTVTMLTAPTAAQKLVILREVDYDQQDFDPVDNDPFPAASIEQAVDYAVMMAQQVKEITDRALRFPKGDSTALTSEIPPAVTRASKALIFDASGNVAVSTDNYEDQAVAAAASAAAASASASAASTSASTASTQASNASTSATNASNSAAAAAASAASLPNAASIGAGKVPQSDGALWAGITVTAAGAALIDDASASDQRTTLGLGTAATVDVIDEDTFATDSATRPPSQQSTSVYVATVPANEKSAAYTTVLSDAGKSIDHPSTDANARTFTIDSNANVAYPIGTCISFSNMTANVVTIAITSDTMYLAGTGTTGSRSLAQYGMATARKLTSTTWLIGGSGLT